MDGNSGEGGGSTRVAGRRGEVPVKRYEVSSVPPGGKNATSGIPQNPLHSSLHSPPHEYVEEGHKLGVRHVGGLGHVAPM